MNRRHFLGVAAGSVASAGTIGWLVHHFYLRPPWDQAIAAMGDVSEAYGRAFTLGKPLLVLIIPESDRDKTGRGEVFGALLNHGGPGVFLDLALCEIVCSTVAGVEEQLEDVHVTGEPLMLLVETGESRVTPIDPAIRLEEPCEAVSVETMDRIDRFARERLDTVAAGLRAGILPAGSGLAERARLAEDRLPAKETRALRSALAAGEAIDATALDRGAAIARVFAEDPEARRPRVLRALAEAAHRRVAGGPPPGAKWARGGCCGFEVEGGPPSGINCGMGYAPELSQRFLWFFTKE